MGDTKMAKRRSDYKDVFIEKESLKVETEPVSGKELDRTLGFWHAFVFMVGILFGSGIYITPGLIARQTSCMGMAIIVWFISAIPCLLGALCFCELSCMYGKTGGEYIYLFEAYGDVMGFVCIWVQTIVIAPIGLAVESLAMGKYILQPLYDIESSSGVWLTKSIAISMILISVVINCRSTSFAGKSQVLFTVVQTLSIFFIIVLGIWQVSIGHVANYATMFTNASNFNIGSFGMAFYDGLWGYDGWDMTVNVAEELKDMEKNLWLSTFTSIPFVGLCFVLINLAFMSVLKRDQIASSSTVATTFVENIFGKKFAFIMPLMVSLCCFGCINGVMFMMTRMSLSAAREGQLPWALSLIHKQLCTPIPAIITMFVLTMTWILIPSLDIEGLITICNLCIWLQHFLAIFSVIVMRVRRPDLKRPIKIWIIIPIFTSIVSLFLVIIPFFQRPMESSVCFALHLTALPLYFCFITRYQGLPFCLHKTIDKFNKFLVERCNLVPCVYDDKSDAKGSVNGGSTESLLADMKGYGAMQNSGYKSPFAETKLI